MTKVYKENVIKYLPDLADYNYQKRVWATGKPQSGDMSPTFIEACCQLFDDTGLGDALKAGETVFSTEADQAIQDLSDVIDKVGFYKGPDSAIIDTPAMQNVREKAAKALQLILQAS